MSGDQSHAIFPIAHVSTDSVGNWLEPQALSDHLAGVASLSGMFAGEFGSKDFGRLIGFAHDLGKWTPEWQAYLKAKSGYPGSPGGSTKVVRVEHSIHGAKVVAATVNGIMGKVLSFPIAGHHAGLPDWDNPDAPASSLKERLAVADVSRVPPDANSVLKALPELPTPPAAVAEDGLALSLWIRMLFSCLVDADRLDAERYDSPERADQRSSYLPVSQLIRRFDSYMEAKRAGSSSSQINVIRNRIQKDCINAAEKSPGVFSLTVPTGGGKTLSSLAFALRHALKFGKRRIIYVIPYTSIIEQNAQVFKDALGSDQVVEHHSNVIQDELAGRELGSISTASSDDADDNLNNAVIRRRLAVENWDATVIVTTTVQFFESLFSDSPSRCRKLHNVANSVVVLDEAQLLPPEFLSPILETLGLLVRHYGVTLVLSTATQPAFGKRPGFNGLGDIPIHEMVGDVPGLFSMMKRTVFERPALDGSNVTWKTLAVELASERQVLCVVSDRRSCRELHGLMPEGTYHLSALMCPEHRTEVINKIKSALGKGETLRVISTQLVEAGVDLDFPVVYRAMAGLDSIAQAAGRCNREGRLDGPGRVKVFVPERQPPVGLLRKAADTSRELLRDCGDDLADPTLFSKYFSLFYSKARSLDAKNLSELLAPGGGGLRFRSAAFQMIDNGQISIAVPHGKGRQIIEGIARKGFPDFRDLRALQRFVVTVPPGEFEILRARNSVTEVTPGLWALVNELEYSERTGLLVREIENDANMFVVT